MKFVFPKFSFTLFCSCILLFSCKHTDETNISGHFDTSSHNMGDNCMHCHKVGGEGKGWFTAAGTIYDSTYNHLQPNGTIRLYTSLDSTRVLRATIDVDGKGNFYTTANIDYSGGLYAEITGTGGDVRIMPTPTGIGACNNCHDGHTNPRIWVK